jgi:outer membrane protein TolC
MRKHLGIAGGKRSAALFLALAMAAAAAVPAMADTPKFAYDDATWARLRDNTMEYDELEMLVETYNPTYLNNQSSFAQDLDGKNNKELRQQSYDSAQDMLDQADSLRDTADTLKDTIDGISQAAAYMPAGTNAMSKNYMNLASSYASLSSAAAMLEQNALRTQQSADASYQDQKTRNYEHQNTQLGLKAQTKSLFASYNLAKKNISVLEENLEVAKRSLAGAQSRAAQGLATATDVLKAQNQVQSVESSLTSTKANVEQLRQSLCIATGWKYNDQPEIRELPASDPSQVDAMNPDADTAAALDQNLALKYSRACLANMTAGSTEYKNRQRTIANQEATVRSTVRTLYNTCVTDRTALEAASAALATEQKKMSAVENQRRLGMVTDLAYLSQQVSLLSAQVSAATADMNLQQAIENYHFAMRGYISGVTVS